MLASTSDTIRLSLHVLGATVWVGGQVTVAALLPVLRMAGATVPREAARVFARWAWPAFVLLLITGMWNISAVSKDDHGTYRTVLIVKLVVVALSGLTAFLHVRATTRAGLAVGGALSALTALGALVLGVVLSG